MDSLQQTEGSVMGRGGPKAGRTGTAGSYTPRGLLSHLIVGQRSFGTLGKVPPCRHLSPKSTMHKSQAWPRSQGTLTLSEDRAI